MAGLISMEAEAYTADQVKRIARTFHRIREVACPKCSRRFYAAFEYRKRKILNTPCCGWVGKGEAPYWARRAR